MEHTNPENHWSTTLGLLTGPVMILLGVLALRFSDRNPGIAYMIILFGVVRLIMSALLYFKRRNSNQ